MKKGYSINFCGALTDPDGNSMASVDYNWYDMDYAVATTLENAINCAIANTLKELGEKGIECKITNVIKELGQK